jgi:ATP-dependent Clp protease adaptor protein ClpS
MADEKKPIKTRQANAGSSTHAAPKKAPGRTPPRRLPNYKVLLHNDDENEMGYVVGCIRMLVALQKEEAVAKMWEAHLTGVALLTIVHKERAELYVEQFASCALTVTIEPE